MLATQLKVTTHLFLFNIRIQLLPLIEELLVTKKIHFACWIFATGAASNILCEIFLLYGLFPPAFLSYRKYVK